MLTFLALDESAVPATDEWLSPPERARARRMRYTKRLHDFLLARWTAKRAVSLRLGLSDRREALAAVEIHNASDGAPYVLVAGAAAPLEIAMTDRAGWAVCALYSPGVRIGCDLELVEPRSDAFVTDYLTAAERGLVRDAGPTERDLLANLIWSAKESALKVLRTGLRRDTRSVEVRPGDVTAAGGWLPLRIDTEEGRSFPGWWCRFGDFLLTVAAEAAVPAPRSVVDPPGLAGAVPTDSWLASPLVEPGAPLRIRPAAAGRPLA
ncbi:4'-phosphopantetheinyl transferase superfamily protein [Candidatus Binatia bacterium]|nr:4'-phosphopantetheinyl transferase superfamily protein [Candidatus Binatia bacterium]